jgi:hypothetical protein
MDYFVSNNCHLWLDHLARTTIPKIDAYKEPICDAINFKLELDAFIFSLPLNRIVLCVFTGYERLSSNDHLLFIRENKISLATNDSLSNMDSICHTLKFLHIAI